LRCLEARAEVEQRVHELERELTDAEEEDRRLLGDALDDGTKPPTRKTERARTAFEKANAALHLIPRTASVSAGSITKTWSMGASFSLTGSGREPGRAHIHPSPR
jgi:hypothetical protein